ncbi:TPA: HNH endonuclease [Vibrio diabolicus]
MKLKLLEKKKDIRGSQKYLEERLSSKLNRNLTCTIGFPSGSWETDVSYNQKIWFHTYRIDEEGASKRYWNGFGVAKELNDVRSNNIVVEINIPIVGINRRVSGAFATDNEGKTYLLHRGRIGGGRKGIGKSAFLDWADRKLNDVESSEAVEQYLVVCCLDDKLFDSNLYEFIKDIYNFKKYAVSLDVDDISLLGTESIENLLNNYESSEGVPKYTRSELIKEITRRRAKGVCQLCKQSAPFVGKNGKPFLEVHHVEWLSRGGKDQTSNTVALCPNCHRKMHILDDKTDVDKLKEIVRVP